MTTTQLKVITYVSTHSRAEILADKLAELSFETKMRFPNSYEKANELFIQAVDALTDDNMPNPFLAERKLTEAELLLSAIY